MHHHHLLISAITAAAACSAASALVNPFTEHFAAGNSNWADGAGTLLTFNPVGGPDGSGYVSTNFSFAGTTLNQQLTIFRGQGNLDSSGDAFVGNWIAGDVDTFSFMIRHNAAQPLFFFTRFANPNNFPGAAAVNFSPILPGQWTQITIAIDPSNPQFVSFEGTNFNAVFSSIGNIQIGLEAPAGLAGTDTTVTFDLDMVSISSIPAPGALALIGLAGLRRSRRRA